jgi:hypothetical protein
MILPLYIGGANRRGVGGVSNLLKLLFKANAILELIFSVMIT